MRDRRFDRFIERFDRFIERTDERWERSDERWDRSDERLERFDQRMERHMDETRGVIREAAIRQERALQQSERRLKLLEAEFHDSRDERRAFTEALWTLVDEIKLRLPPPPPEPA